jgi:hypothetical protein
MLSLVFLVLHISSMPFLYKTKRFPMQVMLFSFMSERYGRILLAHLTVRHLLFLYLACVYKFLAKDSPSVDKNTCEPCRCSE